LPQIVAEGSQPRDVPTRPRQTRYESGLDRIHADLGHDDRDRACRFHGRKRRWLTRCHDDIDWQTHEFRGKEGKLFCIAACVPVLDSDVLPVDIAAVTQTLLEVADISIGAGWGAAVTEPA